MNLPGIGDPSRIPDLGSPLEVHAGDLSAVFRCKCRTENRPVLLTSVHNVWICNGCRGVYRIVQAVFDISQTPGGPKIAVALVGHAEEASDQKRILE